MKKIDKFTKITIVIFATISIIIVALAYDKAKSDILIKKKEQAVLNYYQDTETLLDSLCIDCGDTILETDAGANYLGSKYTFDSLFINK